MEARHIRPLVGLATVLFLSSLVEESSAQAFRGQREQVAQSQNFIVFASSQSWANQVAEVAERHRRDLANYWLGHELPTWSERCPIHVHSSPQLGAGGETRFSLLHGSAGNWMMSVQGSEERILDSVLPHEITHTIFATHFGPLGKYVPRWADEGACTTVEHEAEKSKHRHFLHEFLKTGRGLAFNRMFSLKEYPDPILPLYAQGHSAVQFLLDQGGPQKFIKFLETGMQTEAWENSLRDYYAYNTIGEFQTLWNQWLLDGSPNDLLAYAPGLRKAAQAEPAQPNAEQPGIALTGNALANNAAPNGSDGQFQFAVGAGNSVPVNFAANPVQQASPAMSSDPPALSAVALSSSAGLASGEEPMVEELGSESWYKRRLLEVSGSPATPVPEHNITANNAARASAPSSHVSANTYANGLRPQTRSQAAARPQPAQSPGIQVLDWGDRQPVPGLQPTAQPVAGSVMVPIIR